MTRVTDPHAFPEFAHRTVPHGDAVVAVVDDPDVADRDAVFGGFAVAVDPVAVQIEGDRVQVYLSDDGSQMTVVHIHADSASLEYHMDVAGPVFRRLADLITLSSIRIYGEPSEKALRQLHDKAVSLGEGDVSVHRLHSGFSRFVSD